MYLRLIKMLDIAIVGNLYFFMGVAVSFLINKYIVKSYDEKRTKFQNLLQLILEISTLMISVYLIRILVKNYLNQYNPLNGLFGFDSARVKEINGSVVLALAFTYFLSGPIHNKADKLFFHSKNQRES